MTFVLNPGSMRHRVRIEREVAAPGFMKRGSGSWEEVATVSAEVQDMLPSRAERLDDTLTIASRPARIRMRYRCDVTADMRLLVGHEIEGDGGQLVWITDRTMQIVAGPATLGRLAAIEVMAENYSTAGNAS